MASHLLKFGEDCLQYISVEVMISWLHNMDHVYHLYSIILTVFGQFFLFNSRPHGFPSSTGFLTVSNSNINLFFTYSSIVNNDFIFVSTDYEVFG